MHKAGAWARVLAGAGLAAVAGLGGRTLLVRWRVRRARQARDALAPDPLLPSLPGPPAAPDPAALPPVQTHLHRLQLLRGASQVWARLVEETAGARQRVLVETDVYRDDIHGRALARALVSAAARGVECRLLYDALASYESAEAFFDELRSRGVEVRAVPPLRALAQRARLAGRDQARLLVVDDVAYTRAHAWPDAGPPGHDLVVRVQGPGVEDVAQAFHAHWHAARGRARRAREGGTGADPGVEVVVDGPAAPGRILARTLEAVAQARQRVWLELAWFWPPPALLERLHQAAARGVDVRVLLPAHSERPALQRAARSCYRHWLHLGLRVFEYQPARLHSRCTLVDGGWCSLGTLALDGAGCGQDVNLVVQAPDFVGQVASVMTRDLEAAQEVREPDVRHRHALPRAGDAACRWLVQALHRLAGWPTRQLPPPLPPRGRATAAPAAGSAS